jgi:hypothetical protein
MPPITVNAGDQARVVHAAGYEWAGTGRRGTHGRQLRRVDDPNSIVLDPALEPFQISSSIKRLIIHPGPCDCRGGNQMTVTAKFGAVYTQGRRRQSMSVSRLPTNRVFRQR